MVQVDQSHSIACADLHHITQFSYSLVYMCAPTSYLLVALSNPITALTFLSHS